MVSSDWLAGTSGTCLAIRTHDEVLPLGCRSLGRVMAFRTLTWPRKTFSATRLIRPLRNIEELFSVLLDGTFGLERGWFILPSGWEPKRGAATAP